MKINFSLMCVVCACLLLFSPTAEAQKCIDYSEDDCPEGCMLLRGCDDKPVCYEATNLPECGALAYSGPAACCPGLSKRCGIEFFGGDCHLTVEGSPDNVPTCLPCGNGICNQFENRCNCPEDCGEGKNKLNWKDEGLDPIIEDIRTFAETNEKVPPPVFKRRMYKNVKKPTDEMKKQSFNPDATSLMQEQLKVLDTIEFDAKKAEKEGKSPQEIRRTQNKLKLFRERLSPRGN